MLSHVKLGKKELSDCLEKLLDAHQRFQKWNDFAPSAKSLKDMLFKKNDETIPQEKKADFFADCEVVSGLKKAVAWLDNRSVEEAIVSNFVPLISKFAGKWRHLDPHNDNFGDFFDEGCLTVINAIYQWDGRTKMITYLYRSLHNKMMTAANRDSMFCPMNLKDRKILERFNNFRKDFPLMTFDEVIEAVKFTKKEIAILCKLMNKILLESDLQNGEDDEEEDYTSLRTDLVPQENGWVDLQAIINNVELNPVEQQILEACRQKPRGWQSELSEIALADGKKHSKQSIGIIYHTVIAKLRRQKDRMVA
jgi:DNA-directed RNA polymerase specialized sigma24 family protein